MAATPLNARILDGLGHAPFTGNVRVQGDLITAVGDAQPEEGDEILDLSGLTLLPGLIDAHVHFGGSADPGEPPLAGAAKTDWYAEARRKTLDHGVTAVRSGGDFEADILALRDKINSGELEGPRIFTPGRGLQSYGGHPAFTAYGGDPEIAENAFAFPETPEDAEREILRQAALGADHIKAFLADENLARPDVPVPRLRPEVFRAAVSAAHRAGLRVMVHCQEPDFVIEALEAGCDTVEHLMCASHALKPIRPGTAELFRRRNAIAVPTIVSGFYFKSGDAIMDAQARMVAYLHEHGVRLAAGTDCGIPFIDHGAALHKEMELMHRAGLTVPETVAAATSGSAAAIGRSDIGAVAPGKKADLTAVGGDIFEDIGRTRDIRLVMTGGRIVRRA